MNLNIIIPTRNNYLGVNRLLESIRISGLKISKIFVVDDSTAPMNNKKLKEICTKYAKLNIKLIDNKNIKQVKHPPQLNSLFKLGNCGWNLGNARNLGILYSCLHSKDNTYTIFLDDDIIISKQFNINKNIKNKLIKIRIMGCPDFSRLEWIQLYIKTNFKNISIPSRHIEYFYNKTKKITPTLLFSFTDLYEYPKLRMSNNLIFPQRKELSGGAFICSNNLFKTSAFPNWYNEDWFWFDRIRNERKIISQNINLFVFHNPNKKEILNDRMLLLEEDGEILTRSAKQLILLKKSREKTLRQIILMEKTRSIDCLIKIIASLKHAHKITDNDLKIKLALSKLCSLIQKREICYYKNILKNFNKTNIIWKKFLLKITPSHYL